VVGFDFYTHEYLGSAIPEKAFSGVAARAEAVLARFKRIYRVESDGEMAQKLAVCAMAEELYRAAKHHSGLRAAEVGSVSVRYDALEPAQLTRALYRCAGTYLQISRGVG